MPPSRSGTERRNSRFVCLLISGLMTRTLEKRLYGRESRLGRASGKRRGSPALTCRPFLVRRCAAGSRFYLVQFVDRSRQNLIGRSLGHNRQEQTESLVELNERGGASFVGLHADLDGFGAVIFALKQAPSAAIADGFDLGRPFFHVVNRLAFFAGAAAAQALNNLIDRQLVVHHGAEGQLFV